MTAWAIIVDGEIEIRTVTTTDVGAMVNWLVVACGVVAGAGVPEHLIRKAFQSYSTETGRDVQCVPVEVRRVLQ